MIQLKLILKCYNCRYPLLAAIVCVYDISLKELFDTPKRKYLSLTGAKIENKTETAKKKSRKNLHIYKKKVTLQEKGS